MPGVPDLGSPPDGWFTLSAYPDGWVWFLYGLGQERYVGEVDVFAFECWVIAGPELDEGSQIFVGYRPTFGEGFGVQ